MSHDCLKVTSYFGERDMHGGRFLADELLDLYERHALQSSILLRGIEGFGIKHRLQTQRLLTLSEDLPVVTVGVDTRERIEPVLDEIQARLPEGLLTVERARLLNGDFVDIGEVEDDEHQIKLTVYLGRTERIGRSSAAAATVALLRRHGVAGATVFLGVDGTRGGERKRGRFFSRNCDVPMMVVSVGTADTIGPAMTELRTLLSSPLATIERVRILKRDGLQLAELAELPEQDEAGMQIWQKLMIYAGEQARYDTHPLYVQLIRRLREANGSGATALRGVWGYHGDHAPHGDRLLSLRRHVPVVTIVVDRPEEIRRLWPIVNEATTETGLVTSELVPAFRAAAHGREHGGLHLAWHRS